ncbi:GspH/FimT family protein [Thiohalorhabdus methylotrophus]|uniref:Type II secretion system protein H n=1 Tax=Thiohalorhabdus methylotrophus TaxID=3242694 RepID=A0ABV4U0U4_9GAMM
MTKRSASPARPGSLGSRGFTLLELLVVVALVAIMMGLVVPSLGLSTGRSLSEAADRMVLLVNRARQEAVLSTRTWRVVLEPEEGSYRFQKRRGQEFDQAKESPFAAVRRDPGLRWEKLVINGAPASGSGEVYLYPSGEQDTFRLTLRNGDKRRTVVLGPVGRARVERPE